MNIKVVFMQRKHHEYSYRNMQLSQQAGERQKKNILQMALRFHQRASEIVAEPLQRICQPSET